MLSIKRMKVINDEGMLESKLQIIAEMDVKRTEKFIEQDGIDDVTFSRAIRPGDYSKSFIKRYFCLSGKRLEVVDVNLDYVHE